MRLGHRDHHVRHNDDAGQRGRRQIVMNVGSGPHSVILEPRRPPFQRVVAQRKHYAPPLQGLDRALRRAIAYGVAVLRVREPVSDERCAGR